MAGLVTDLYLLLGLRLAIQEVQKDPALTGSPPNSSVDDPVTGSAAQLHLPLLHNI